MPTIPKFIVFEGPDGVGKSSVTKMVTELCAQHNIPALLTFEPTEQVNREMLFKLNPLERYHMFVEDRIQHLKHRVNPALANGINVICDRYVPSTLVYQTLDHKEYTKIKQELSHFQRPDILVYLTAPFETVSQELAKREVTYSYEKLEFRKLVSAQYDEVVNDLEKDGWKVIRYTNDFTKTIQEMSADIFKQLFDDLISTTK